MVKTEAKIPEGSEDRMGLKYRCRAFAVKTEALCNRSVSLLQSLLSGISVTTLNCIWSLDLDLYRIA